MSRGLAAFALLLLLSAPGPMAAAEARTIDGEPPMDGVHVSVDQAHRTADLLAGLADEMPGNVARRIAAAEAYADLGEYESAMECYTQALETEPKHYRAMAGRGLCALYLQRYAAAEMDLEKALRYYEAAVARDEPRDRPFAVHGWYALGYVRQCLGETEDGMAAYTQCVQVYQAHIDEPLDGMSRQYVESAYLALYP